MVHPIKLEAIFVYRMEFDKTRWSCSWNSDQNCTQKSFQGGHGGWSVYGVKGLGRGSLVTIWYEIDPLCMT